MYYSYLLFALVCAFAVGMILLLPDLGRFVWRLAESPPGEDIVIGTLLLVTIAGAVMGVQPVLRRRRRIIAGA